MLDEGDRFLNAQTAKYIIRNGAIEDADEMMKRWSSNDENKVSSHEMENTWYSLLSAKAHQAKGQYIESFRLFNIIERGVNAQYDDSYEFHLYTI